MAKLNQHDDIIARIVSYFKYRMNQDCVVSILPNGNTRINGRLFKSDDELNVFLKNLSSTGR